MLFRLQDSKLLACLLALSLGLTLFGCGSQSSRLTGTGNGNGSGSGTGNGGGGDVTLKYAGTAFDGEFVDATVDGGVFGFGASTTADGVTHTLQITVMGAEAGESYTFALIGSNIGVWTRTVGAGESFTTYTATSGQIHVDTLDENGATGTFSFTGTKAAGEGPETIEITDGVFNVTFE